MKIASQLTIALPFIFMASFQAMAVSFEKAETKLQQYSIDPGQLGELLGKQVSDWQTLTPKEKEIFVKGVIINLDMETSENAALFDQHTQASIQCMHTKGHGLKLPPSEDISLPIIRCITDTYEAYHLKNDQIN
jgi:hypothetical protein